MKIQGIIIHCSDSPQGRGDGAEEIHNWHLQNGWDGIGYHYVITEEGTIEKGRPNFWNGSHTRGFNDTHLGICLIGIDKFTEKQCQALANIVRNLMFTHKISSKNVIGHYMADSKKTCPNFNVVEFMHNYNLI